MIGVRRQREYVVARTVVWSLSLGVMFVALGNLIVIGSAFALVRGAADPAVMWVLLAAAVAQFVGGSVALLALGWAR